MYKATKVRIYPTPEQEKFLNGQFGAVRFCYNKSVALKKRFYRKKGVNIKINKDLKPLLSVAKKNKKYKWLGEYDSVALQQGVRNADAAFVKFFKKDAKIPHFHSKRTHNSSYHSSGVEVGPDWIRIPKLKKIGNSIRAKIHRPIEGTVSSITVSRDPDGKYYASILSEVGLPEPEKPKSIALEEITAIDVGLIDTVTESNGRKTPNQKYLKKSLKKIKKLNRKLSKKKKGGKRREKTRKRLAKVHKKVANQRADFLHKLSRRLVDENQAIGAESLQIKNMVKNRRLSRAISDVGWGRLLTMIQYKAEREGKYFVKADKFFPSSKTCSSCGHKMKEMDLSVREWTCPKCGAHHDRDVNAAVNLKAQTVLKLKAAGLTVYKAHGADVSPEEVPAIGNEVRSFVRTQ